MRSTDRAVVMNSRGLPTKVRSSPNKRNRNLWAIRNEFGFSFQPPFTKSPCCPSVPAIHPLPLPDDLTTTMTPMDYLPPSSLPSPHSPNTRSCPQQTGYWVRLSRICSEVVRPSDATGICLESFPVDGCVIRNTRGKVMRARRERYICRIP